MVVLCKNIGVIFSLLLTICIFSLPNASSKGKQDKKATSSECGIQLNSPFENEVQLVSDRLSFVEISFQFDDVIFWTSQEKTKSLAYKWMLVESKLTFSAHIFLQNFLLFPLWTLERITAVMDIEVKSTYQHCVFNSSAYLIHLQNLVLQNLTASYRHYYLCSHNLLSNEIVCCRHLLGSKKECSKETYFDSRNYFISFVFFVKIIAVLLLVGFLPKSLYETRNGYREYVHVLNSPLEIQVATKNAPSDIARADGNILGTTSSTRTRNNRYLHKDHIQKLSDYVRHKKLDQDHPQVFKLHAVWIKVNQNRLLSVNSAPVRVINFLYRRLLECKCYMQGIKGTKRKEESNTDFVSLHDCCSRKICFGNTWQTFSRESARIFIFVLVSLLPWMFYIFLSICDDQHSSTLPFQKFTFFFCSKSINTLPLYIMCCVFWVIPFILYSWISLISNPVFKLKTGNIFRRNIRIVKNPANVGWSWSASFFLRPFASKRNSNILFFTLRLLLCLLSTILAGFILILVNLPTLYLYIRLLYSFSRQIYLTLTTSKDKFKEKGGKPSSKHTLKERLNIPNTDKRDDLGNRYELEMKNMPDKLQWILLCFIWIIFLLFSISPFIDIVIVTVDILLNVIIGTLIGFKVTALFVLTFVSLIFYRDVIFTPIELKFQDFSRKLQKYLKENYTKTTLNTIVSSRAGLMGNCAIQVIPKSDGCKKCLSNYALSSEDGVPKLEAKYMVQFLDKHANTHIARSFFFECCYMDHFACPGSASDLLYTASRSFVLTTLYLFCVTAVLTIFGDLLGLTFYIQIVAFISAATLPFIIRNSVFGHSNESPPRIDQNDEGFRLSLENLLREFSQKWTVIDFEISERHVDDLLQISTDSDYINKFESWFSTPSREFISVIIRDNFNERLPFLTSSVRSSISKQGKGSSEFTDRTVDILRTHTIQYNGRPPGIKRKEEKADSIPKERKSQQRRNEIIPEHNRQWDSHDSDIANPLTLHQAPYAFTAGAEYTTDARERHKHHPQQTGQEILDFMRTLTDQGDGQDIHRTDMEYVI